MRRLASALVAVLALTVGCSGDDDDAAGGTTSTAPLHAEDDLTDGRHFGLVTALDPTQLRLVFDRAELLEGDEAEAAAEDAGDVVTDGGFYIHNPEDRMNRVSLADGVEIRLRTPCCELSDHDFESWLTGFDPDDRTFFGTADSSYWITIADGEVVEVEEAYLGG